jgi:hypothetical protein
LNHFTETHTTGYGENIGNSFKGILFGFFLIIASVILLSYNENRSINQTLALEEMQSKIVTLPDTKHDIKYENSPILIQGEVTPKHTLLDSQFDIKSEGLALYRQVEMYQWRERKTSKSEDKLGGGTETVTTYDYIKEWSSHATSSSSFKHPQGHENPTMGYEKKTFTTDATIGDFYLSKNIISNFENKQSFNGLSSLPKEINGFVNHQTFLYKGADVNTPAIGDIKITYTQTPKRDYSIMGMAKDKAVVPYLSQNDRDFLFIRTGKVSAHQIFQEEFSSNTTLTWILRAVGLALMFFGFMLIMGPLATFANVIPMVGSLVEGASALVAGVLTLLLGSIVIAIAWFASRPLLSLAIIGVGIGLTLIAGRFKKEKVALTSPPPRRSSGATPPPRR